MKTLNIILYTCVVLLLVCGLGSLVIGVVIIWYPGAEFLGLKLSNDGTTYEAWLQGVFFILVAVVTFNVNKNK